jgi:hypothetical protein
MKKKAVKLCVEKKKRIFMAELQTTVFYELKKTQQHEAGDFFIGSVGYAGVFCQCLGPEGGGGEGTRNVIREGTW